ncbi:uncharacterized protein LOC107638463 [Arachis ipaensis]|uniref:uncharacterized protein LOC107638463 n=1 Tax=Arachis ipaensis TaxID=130454 RepID=UPI0007AF764D|nr:uncharacterized protein LOC107638463 [Arachis ipaensis]
MHCNKLVSSANTSHFPENSPPSLSLSLSLSCSLSLLSFLFFIFKSLIPSHGIRAQRSMENTAPTPKAPTSFLNQNTFAAFSAIKLNENNYKAWKKQALACIKVNKLQSHLDPRMVPARFSSESDRHEGIEAQSYTDWEVQDQCLVAWLTATMESNFVNRVIEYDYAYQIWNVLSEYFESRVKSRIKQLKTQLKTLKKHGSPVTEYMAKINQVADALSALGAPLTKDEYIEAALGGLGEEYNVFITVATARIEETSESEFESQLLAQEELVDRFRRTELGPVQANIAQREDIPERFQGRGFNNYRGGFRGSRGRGYFRGTGRSSWWQGSRPQCQLCGKLGHTAVQCFHRFNQDFMNPQMQPLNAAQPPSAAFHNGTSSQNSQQRFQEVKTQPPAPLNPQAFLTLPSALPDTAWYPDSGASHHITFDKRNLITGSDYDGTEQVFGGNGQDLQENPPSRIA